MPSPPLLAESHRLSMIFLLSSGCCSSLRWKKGKRKTDRRKAEKQRVEKVESKRDNQRTHGWHGDGVTGARLSLSQECECE